MVEVHFALDTDQKKQILQTKELVDMWALIQGFCIISHYHCIEAPIF